jgi:hypothetical protein
MNTVPSLGLAEQCELARCTLHRAPHHLSRLVHGPLADLGVLLFLLDNGTGDFLAQEAPRLASLLRRRSERVSVPLDGRIRGRVDWQATTRARMQSTQAYVCRNARPDYDQLENQYFVFVLHTILGCVRQVGLKDHALCWGEAPEPILGVLAARRGNWERIQHLLPSGGITLPRQITAAHERAIQQARLREYQAIPRVWTLYSHYILLPNETAWQDALQKSMPYHSRWDAYHQEFSADQE